MIRKEFSIVSPSEAGDYFQVLFEQEADSPETDYFLLQCQFEDPDDEDFYIGSNDTQFCGPFKLKLLLFTLSNKQYCLRLLQVTSNFLASPDYRAPKDQHVSTVLRKSEHGVLYSGRSIKTTL